MREKIAHYGLRVMADYSSVIFPDGAVRFVGEGTFDGACLELCGEGVLTLSGEATLKISGSGRLAIRMEGSTAATISTLTCERLEVGYRGVAEMTRISHEVHLAAGAVYRERIAMSVAGLLDISTVVTHHGAATSDLASRVAVAEGAKAIVRGKIVMGNGAEGSKGMERIDALLLGPTAEMDALPTLVVDTDDVTCKHAASVGHIDENSLFYMAIRGIGPAEARAALTEAFLQLS